MGTISNFATGFQKFLFALMKLFSKIVKLEAIGWEDYLVSFYTMIITCQGHIRDVSSQMYAFNVLLIFDKFYIFDNFCDFSRSWQIWQFGQFWHVWQFWQLWHFDTFDKIWQILIIWQFLTYLTIFANFDIFCQIFDNFGIFLPCELLYSDHHMPGPVTSVMSVLKWMHSIFFYNLTILDKFDIFDKLIFSLSRFWQFFKILTNFTIFTHLTIFGNLTVMTNQAMFANFDNFFVNYLIIFTILVYFYTFVK